MKRIIAIIGTLCVMAAGSYAQGVSEVGIGLGINEFMGDLGRKNPKGNTYFDNITAAMTKPAGTFFYSYSCNQRFTVKIAFTGTENAGNDAMANTTKYQDDGWFRQYRNLNFRSKVLELTAMGQLNILKYSPGSMKYRWTPYVTAGVGVFYFDPKTEYQGQWIALQPLGTEGQGLPQFPDRKKYSLVQPDIPIGVGVKFNVNHAFAVGVEFTHRVCFTDYLDDVSKTYVSLQDFVSYYGEAKGTMIYNISRRSQEIDPEGHYGTITGPGQPRGNPNSNDSWATTVVTLTYNLSKITLREHNAFGNRRVKRYRRVFH